MASTTAFHYQHTPYNHHDTQHQNIPFSPTNTYEEEEDYTIEKSPTMYRCDTCGKTYKSSNCLFKHQWEHSEQWEFTSKFLLTKHQQVQMLEAASILVQMKQKAA
ncbi:hypothetical protein EDC96DRAFT_521619 [Choanephora cucurbitarum]|nr:hypothetical protein EDC96DRAFT_521619 [Choanephora cucurbitarum]